MSYIRRGPTKNNQGRKAQQTGMSRGKYIIKNITSDEMGSFIRASRWLNRSLPEKQVS
jgi:hypothetical protein